MKKSIKNTLIGTFSLCAIASIILTILLVKHYYSAQSKKEFMKTPEFVLIRDFKNAKTAEEFEEVKIIDKKELQALWNALNYRFFLNIYEYGDSSDNNLSVWYPNGQFPDGKYSFVVLDVNSNGKVGVLRTLKSHIEYEMPEYVTTVQNLYKKHKIHNEVTPVGTEFSP